MRNLFLALFGLFCIHTSLQAQSDVDSTILEVFDYSSPQEYEIGGIEVAGAVYSDKNAIIGVSGLVVGQKINFPSGGDIQRSVRALWKLNLFTDLSINVTKQIGNVVFLEILVEEQSRLVNFTAEGDKKSKLEDIRGIIGKHLARGGIVTSSRTTNAVNGIKTYYAEKGYLDADVQVVSTQDENLDNGIRLKFIVDRKNKVKIQNITFSGNNNVKARKLRKKMKETKRKSKIFKASKLVKAEYETDKEAIIAFYNTEGYRDAKIVSDSIWREEDGDLMIHITIDEGNQYYFRNIRWKGNTIYSSDQLSKVLGIGKGDAYNEELLDNRLSFSQDGRDVSSLYMDNGYLFFRVEPIEVSIDNDSIDLEMRMFEGPIATISDVVIKGNDRTNEHVIRRELRTKPGQKFSRSDIIRSQREIINLGYFDPETLDIQTPVNAERGTVAIEYTVSEKSSDQLELSAGWAGRSQFNAGGVIGTLGLTFNNFSLKNIFNKEAWHPLPQGDGQRLSLRAQSNGQFYQSINFSLTEPWLGGKKPTSFTVSSYYSIIRRITAGTQTGKLGITGASVSLGTRLKFPDDFFVSSTAINYQRYSLDNYLNAFFLEDGTSVSDGVFNNLALAQTFSRNSINNPIFPESGSKISLTMELTLPYSMFNDKDYSEVSATEKFKWVEYHKWRFDAEWYTPLFGKFVLKSSLKLGMLGHYNEDLGTTPFERFELGGDGIANQFAGITGRDIFSLRGYEDGNTDFEANTAGATVFNKMTLELRYPVSLNPNSTVFLLGFFQGGNAWGSFREFNPFDVKRSAGVGLRVFLPMFGTLGFDYGFGFDKDYIPDNAKITEYGKFNIILGFEPE